MDQQVLNVIKKVYDILNHEDPSERDLERVLGMLETLMEVYSDPESLEPREEPKKTYRLPFLGNE